MKLFKLFVCCLLVMPGIARAVAIGFLEPPEFAAFPQDIATVDADTIGLNNQDGYPILRIWFENGHGKVHSSIFIDFAGNGTLPSAAFQQRAWPSGLPDIHYTILGVMPPTISAQTPPPPPPPPTVVPLPGAVWLFGSGIVGLLLLRKSRPAKLS